MMNSQALRPIEVLMVEDSPSDANLTIRGFARSKIINNLHWVEEGEAAMDYLRQEGEYVGAARPDIILLDLNLPGMDGREVLEEIKSDPKLRRIPVVILTTSADERDVIRSYDLSANCYMTKPVGASQFLELVQLIHQFWLVAVKLPHA